MSGSCLFESPCFSAQSGLPWHIALIRRVLDQFGDRVAGLKDSSGDMHYAREAARIGQGFDVYPSTEAVLIEARAGEFAGCISATANLNADLCARAWNSGEEKALAAAVSIRRLFDGKPLVAGVKAALAHIHDDANWARVQPPLVAYDEAARKEIATAYDGIRARVTSQAEQLSRPSRSEGVKQAAAR